MGLHTEQGKIIYLQEDDATLPPGDPTHQTEPHSFNTQGVVVPCSNVRLGDFVILQGRPCQVLKVSTSTATGQYKYLGVDLFTKFLYQDVSSVQHPAPGVRLHFILAPFLKQYRVLDCQDGSLVATTEDGDVRQGLPVIEQSNLDTRISRALESGIGSVRVLVLSDGDSELAIEMKVIYTNQEERYTEKTLAMALLYGDDSELEARLGDIALGEVDINELIEGGETVLDIAASNPSLYLRAFKLLDRGASPSAHLGENVPQFLSAAATGDMAKIGQLLARGLDINSSDRLGYTALHEAICFGHYETVEFLLEQKADVNRKITHGGATLVHAAIERGLEHRQYLTDVRSIPPRLTQRHVRIVALLLRHGVDTSVRRSNNDLKVKETVFQNLKLERNYQPMELCYLQRILILLSQAPEGGAIQAPPRLQLSAFQCPLEVEVKFLGSRGISETRAPVTKLNNNNWNTLMRKAKELEDARLRAGTRDNWRWIHLPANNKDWAETMGGIFSNLEGSSLGYYQKGLRGFMTSSFNEVKGPSSYARSRKPCFHPLDGSNGSVFSLVIPYFDIESLDCLHRGANPDCSRACRINFRAMKNLRDFYSNSNTVPNAFQEPCTLDQSYYLSLDSPADPDRDQVVVKYFELQEKRRQGLSELDILNSNDPISDAPDESIFYIFEQSIAHWRQREATYYKGLWGHQVQLDSLNKIASSRKLTDSELSSRTSAENEICNITREIHDLRQIKDVGDELKMIERVLIHQKTAISGYVQQRKLQSTREKAQTEKARMELLENESRELDLTLSMLESQMSNVRSLLHEASSVETSLNNLLDLKQKQGSLIAVRDTTSLAKDADQRAKDSNRQSQLLFIFTIITVIFTPISFTSTFMAVPTQEFPHDGGDVSWGWWQVFLAGLIAEAFTFLLVAAWLISQWKDSSVQGWRAWLGYKHGHSQRSKA
ncbi:hypothetical protein ACHAPI_001939 [Fusarium lateritium]